MGMIALQNDFRDWLRSGDDDGAGAGDAAARLNVSDARGLSVYQNNYRAQLLGCLEQSYPQLRAWLGDDMFRAAAARHIDEHPPSSWTLDDYPAGFPEALRVQFPGDPEVAEIAALELRLADCFIAADTDLLELAMLGEVDWDVAQLRLAPSVTLLPLHTNAAAIWSALAHENVPPQCEYAAEPGHLVIWRQDYVSCFRPVDAPELALLDRLQHGLPFADICAILVEQYGEDDGVAEAGALLAAWTRDQVICLAAETHPMETCP